MRARPLLALMCLVAAGSSAWAVTRPVKSLYTTLDLKSCRLLTTHDDGNAWRCKGLAGYPIYLAEGDGRFFISFGPHAEKRRAATQTLGAFNTPFRNRSRRTALVEWRFVRRDNADVPYATILRTFTSNDTGRGQVLVITKVSATEACRVATVDALASEDAIVVARRLADERAPKFDCSNEPTVEGAAGKSPM